MLPNKIVSIADSLIWKLPYIMDAVKEETLDVTKLFDKVSCYFEDASEFILCLDTLYLLDRIECDKDYEVIKYVNGN